MGNTAKKKKKKKEIVSVGRQIKNNILWFDS